MLNIEISQDKKKLLITFDNVKKLDALIASDFMKETEQYIEDYPNLDIFVIDLEGIECIDSLGLGALLHLQIKMKIKGDEKIAILQNCQEDVMEFIKDVSLDKLFEIKK